MGERDDSADEQPEGNGDADTSREGQDEFFSKYADEELAIPSDSERPSTRSQRADADDDDVGDDDDADLDEADREPVDHNDDDIDDDEEGDGKKDDDEDDVDDEGESSKPARRAKADADDDDDEALDKDFQEAAERNKLPVNFEDVVKKLPVEARRDARAAFKGYLRDVKAGYTRLSQEATAFRGERKELLTKLAFAEKDPESFILEAILKDPALMERINKRLPDGDADMIAKLTKIELHEIGQKRAALTSDVEKSIDLTAKREARGIAVDKLARKLSAHYGIEFELVEDRIILEIKESETKDISDDRVREIIKARAKLVGTKRIERKGKERSQWVKDKIAERERGKSTTSKARRQQGRVGAPARVRDSDDLRTNLTRTVAKIAPGMARD